MRVKGFEVVGASGFEPPTSWSRTRRASQAALRPELYCRCSNSLRWIDTTRNRKVQTITNARIQYSGEIQLHLINVTPAPILAGLKRLYDGMLRVMKVLGRMLVLRRVAAANVAAFQAQSQMDPAIAHFQALLAPASVRSDRPDLIEMRAGCHVISSLKDATNSYARM
jgi:hypothetical protein